VTAILTQPGSDVPPMVSFGFDSTIDKTARRPPRQENLASRRKRAGHIRRKSPQPAAGPLCRGPSAVMARSAVQRMANDLRRGGRAGVRKGSHWFQRSSKRAAQPAGGQTAAGRRKRPRENFAHQRRLVAGGGDHGANHGIRGIRDHRNPDVRCDDPADKRQASRRARRSRLRHIDKDAG